MVASLPSDQNVRTVIVLDDGGYALRTIPDTIVRRYDVVAIEQTTSGLAIASGPRYVRRINVAASAAKKKLESDVIARSIVDGMADLLSDSGSVGINGLGNVGRALANTLVGRAKAIHFNDRHGPNLRQPDGVRRCNGLRDLCASTSLIIGCTGTDVFDGADWLGELGKKLILVSASS
jgi:lactate dehydrogenase-like 2-hydroxyacid dehydrogenase